MNSPAPPTPNPPAVLSAVQRHDLARQFEQAKQLATKRPPDYRGVHRFLSACCTLDPGNTLFLAALLENLKSANGKIASAWFWQVRSKKQELRSAMAAKQWGEALATGWWLIGERPQDSHAFVQLAEICALLDHRSTQIQLLNAAYERNPQSPHLVDFLAIALAVAGRFSEAAAMWRKALEINPSEAPDTLRLLAAVGGYAEQPAVVPDELPLKEKIAQLIRLEHWDAAERLLTTEAGAAGADWELRTLGEEITLAQARGRTAIAERLHAISPTPPVFSQLFADLAEEQRRIELGVVYARYERLPAEPESAFELARCLTRAKNFSEALKYLEPLKANSNYRTRAWLAAAENWQHLRQFDRALAAYQEALDDGPLDADHESVRQGWRRGAVLAEAMGQPAVALAWLERLVSANPGDKDAAARLDNLRSICHKGGFSAGPQGTHHAPRDESSRGA